VGNRTIGASALGGMLFGTLFGVIIVPGLYYVFGSLASGKKLIRDEDEKPLSEDYVEGKSAASEASIIKKVLQKISTGNGNKDIE
jgi:HAE1 family hydrophobic/amphiphilic exporter-1